MTSSKILIRMLLVSLVVFFSFPGYAAQSSPIAESFKRGAAHLRKSEWSAAEKELLAITQQKPNHANAHALLGIARYHLKEYRAAVADLLVALENKTRFGARSLYYLGMSLSKLGRTKAAREAFTHLIVTYPRSAEARKLGSLPEDVLQVLEGRKKLDFYRPILTLDAGYNSNPSQLTAGVGDLALIGYASGRVRLRPYPWLVNTAVFFQKYADETELDYVDLSAELLRGYKLSKHDALEPSFRLNRRWLGGESYERVTGFELRHTRKWDMNWDSDAWLSYELNSSLAPEDSDSKTLSLRLRAWRELWTWDFLSRLRVEAQWAQENAETNYLGYTRWRLGTGLRFSLPRDTTLDFGLSYTRDNYSDIHPDQGLQRIDKTSGVNLVAYCPVSANTIVKVQISRLSRSSTLDGYSHDQTLMTVGIVYVP